MKKIVILGPPGTGKTTRLIQVVEDEMAHGVRPNELAYCSFTKEGSEQGKKRAIEKFGCKAESLPYFRTLHSLAFQTLGLQRRQVISKNHYRKFSEKMGMNFLGYYTADLTNNDDKYLFFADLYRNNKRAAGVYLDQLDCDKIAYVRKGFRAFKDLFALYDFTDMIETFIKADKKIPVRVAIIDEAQDLTTLQWQMVWLAFRDCERIYIAGDDDQAIYQWSGADVDHFLSIKGETEILRHSWRLPNDILAYAKRISKQIDRRIDKDYEGTGAGGRVVHIKNVSEVRINPNETYMFLGRNNVHLSGVEDALMRKAVLFYSKGVLSVSQPDVKAINTYERVRKTRVMTDEDRYELDSYLKEGYTLEEPWYDSFKWPSHKSDYIRDLLAAKTKMTEPKIKVSTIHGVKGGEADNVVILSEVTKSVNENIEKNPDAEHRVFYVGCTRARKNLYIVHSDAKYEYPVFRGR